MTVKELKELLEICEDEMKVCFEYRGPDMELERGDCFNSSSKENYSIYNDLNPSVYISFGD